MLGSNRASTLHRLIVRIVRRGTIDMALVKRRGVCGQADKVVPARAEDGKIRSSKDAPRTREHSERAKGKWKDGQEGEDRGKSSITDYEVITSGGVVVGGRGAALLKLVPRTGRTHQV